MTKEKTEQEIQGKSSNPIINQPQNNTKLLRIMTGYNQHASFSTQPACSDIIRNPDLAEFMIHCEKQALADATIQTKHKIL